MSLRHVAMSAVLGLSLVSAPVAAQTVNDPVETVRVGANMDEANSQIFEGSFILPVIIVVAIGLGLYFAVDDSDDEPASP